MRCVLCGTKVASGGDRHRKGGCSVRGKRGEHKGRHVKRAAGLNVARGAPVTGTGKPSASSDKTKKKKKGEQV
jgi:hypothetical protein